MAKTIPLELADDLYQQITKVAEDLAMAEQDWVLQLLTKAVANHQQPGFSSDKHRVLRVLLKDIDANRDRSTEEMAKEAGVLPGVFVAIVTKYPGVKVSDGTELHPNRSAVDLMRHALQQPGL